MEMAVFMSGSIRASPEQLQKHRQYGAIVQYLANVTENGQQQAPDTRKKKAGESRARNMASQGFRTPVAGMKTRDYENMGIYGYIKMYIFQ